MGMIWHKNPYGGREQIDSRSLPIRDCACNKCTAAASRELNREGQRRSRRRGDDRRMQQYRQATSRPEGVQEAGNTSVDGQPGYYEDGGTTGRRGHRDRYYGPNGPFGPDHHHDGSEDGGETWENYH